ncbi:hypothetical protein HR45_12870 [Shewanella mangrovi]|uniref:Outer membrane protein beta-barrel domain-containing protein n=1 Tax=Shewanella mangrovi TaxID=1515746 RepID=A0A094JCJ0_9GAMM|nr:outer membrane beta-barrel protein [Shewanella mangrovi]KFZ36937.1 hypothetical protein HR45_12870 [Shewanella mangrovi]
MKSLGYVFLCSILLSLSSPALADVFVAPFAGYSVGSDGIDLTRYDDGAGKQQDSAHAGIMLGLSQGRYGDVYLLYSRQRSDLLADQGYGYDAIDRMTLEYWHLGGTLYFSQSDLRPYVGSSIGLTRFSPDSSVDATNRFSLGLAAGVTYALSNNLALFAELRTFATFFGNDSGLSCGRDDDCRWYISRDTFWQGQANLGLQLRF